MPHTLLRIQCTSHRKLITFLFHHAGQHQSGNAKSNGESPVNAGGRKYDHGLVCCTLRSRIKMQRKATAKLDFSLLKVDNQLRESFDECVRQKLSSEQYDQNSPAESLAALTKSVSSAASSTIPKCSHRSLRRRNISSRTRELYASRQANYHNMTTEQRKVASRAITNSAREDYRSKAMQMV